MFLGFLACFVFCLFCRIFLGRSHSEFLGLYFFFGHLHLAAEAHVVAMGEEDVLVVVAIPVLLQDGWNFVCGKAFGKQFRMLDVVIVGDTSVFRHLLVVRTEEDMRLVTVAQIGCPHGVFKVGSALGIVVTTSVFIVESESATQLLVGIYCKNSLEVVFTIGPVAATVQCDIGDRRVGVGEMEVAHGGNDIIVWFCEHKVALRVTSVDEDTVDACGTHVAQGVVFSTQSFVEGGVLIHGLHGINHGSLDVAESLVHCPHPDTLRNFLVGAEGISIHAVAGEWAELRIFVVAKIALCRNWDSCSTN